MFVEAFCGYPFTRVRCTSEGDVAMCCFMRPDPLFPKSQAYIGNLLESSFDEIWFGETAEAIRSDTLAGKLHKKCQTPGCPFYSMKRRPLPTQNIIYNEYPTFLEIDLPNTHCNVGGLNPSERSPACIMCERSAPFFKAEEDRLFEVLAKVKQIVPNLSQIHIQGIAEPFYENKASGHLLFDVLDALEFDTHAHQITVSITTNGTLLKHSVRQAFFNRIPHSITTFSIDAATPETFKKIRILDCFDKVLENLYAFAAERMPARQHLQIHNNVNLLNYHEVVGMVEIAHKAEVECLELSPTDGHNREILVNEENCGLFVKAQREATERCEELKVKYKFIRPLDMGISSKFSI